MVSEQCVGEDDELSHDGGECGFGRLSGGCEGLIFVPHGLVEADSDQGWHVEGLTQMSPAAADEALAAALS